MTDREKVNEALILQLALENCREPVEWIHSATMLKIRELEGLLKKDLLSHVKEMGLADIL